MEKFRIGNDLTVFWAILDDDSQPYDLSGKTVKIFLTHPRGRMEITEDVNIQGNVISWLFRGRQQRYLGVYKLTVEIFSSPTTRVLRRDIDQAFSLVSATLYVEESNGRPQINETGKLTLSTILEVYQIMPIVPQVGPNRNWWVDGVDTGKPSTGMSAYEFAKENGYTGTEAEYAAECAAVPALNEESRVATAAASEAADNADRAAGEARRSATVANSASATATNAALAANTAAKAANDAAEAANTAAELSKDQIAAVGQYIGNEVTPAAEAAKQAATKAINAAEAANNAAGSINGATDNANSAAEAANAAATRAEEAIAEFGPAIADKADLENGKIIASQLPDYILGQVMFGGLLYNANPSITGSAAINPSTDFQQKYGNVREITTSDYLKYKGVYFIVANSIGNTFLEIEDVRTGDWIISTGEGWAKIDNTDAVTSVAGLMGNVNASSLAAALADITDSNSLARKTDVPKKLSQLENDIEIGGGGGSYDDSEIKEILSTIVDEEGYLYSNGEKVDMRFTRSLLPVGTSIPASANLNTIEYLKIGKYYCSLNADAKTIKNCPVNVAFSMEVFNPLGTNVDDETTREYTYRLRVLTQYDTGQQYVQFCRTNGTAGSWIYDSWYVTPRVKFALASSKNDGSAAIGATNKGVYIDSTGEIKAMSYTVAKSVPSNAVFTDTNTKVTAVENHYAPAEDEDQQIDAPEGEVVTGIKRDAAGHVVGVVSVPQTGGGGGGIATETDPKFSASAAAGITAEDIAEWNSKQDAITDLDAIRSGSEKGATALQGAYASDELDDVETNTYVKYVAQKLTEEQKEQARKNIGIGEVSSMNYDLNVKAINHRGYSSESPENTIPAYIMSKQKGFTYVEGDVSFTKDSVAVLLHDATIDRTSNGTGDITTLNYQEVLQYDFGSWFSKEYAGVKIPTFKEWMICCKNLGLHPYIELKSAGGYTQTQINQVVNEVEECGMKGKVTYISFSNTFLGYVKNADASARLGLLANPLNSSKISQAKALKTTTNEVFLDAKLSTVTDALISTLLTNDQPLEVWTVNTEEEILKMPSYVSGVTSDFIIAGKVLYENSLVYVPPTSSWIPTTGISLDKSTLAFSSFEPMTLVATVVPSNSSEEIVWKSSNTSIATVNNGVVTPIAEGSCTITATSGDFSASCSVNIAFTRYNVAQNLTGCSLSNTENNVLLGKPWISEIIPNNGYSLKNGTVKVTMGEVDVTSTVYSNGIINIENVTGDIVVTVACVAVPVYSITRNLVGCTSDKNTATIGEGNPYNETFTALENYRLSGATIAITMGDTDISSMYNDGVLSIPEVTGNIVININAEVIPVYSITRNLVNCSTDSSITTIKEGESHNENILANEGYTLRGGNIVITMGGLDISSSLSNTGILSINAVTGNIVINIEAVEYNSALPIVELDLNNVGTDGVIKNLGTGGSTYDATIQTTSTSDKFSVVAGTGLTLNNHAYANIPYVLKSTDNFTIICKAKIATKSSQTYQRIFRTDTDAPSWYYSKSNTKLQAKLSGKNSSESIISVLGSLISGVTGTNNSGNSVIFNTDTTTVRELMFTCDGTDIKLYIDGKLSASQPASGLTETAYIGIGDNNTGSKYYASALEINRFAIYDSVITDDVIAEDPVNIRLTNENLSQGAINSKNQASGSYELISPYRTNMTTRAATSADLSILVNGGKTVSVEAKDKNGSAMQVGIQTFGDDALAALSNEESIYPYIIDSGWVASGSSYQIPITHKYAWIVVSYPNTSTTVDVNNIDYIQITEVNS